MLWLVIERERCLSFDRFIMNVFNLFPGLIFNKEIVQRIDTANKSIVFINFGFGLKSIDLQSPANLLGFSRLNFSEILNSKSAFHKKCPIVNESEMTIGWMTAKIELGINELHFGRELIGEFIEIGKSSLSLNFLCIDRSTLQSSRECFCLQR